jgi:tetratricopeptide (TPR) repeat protein
MMKSAQVLVVLAVLGGSTAACSRDSIEAVNLAIEGDKARDLNIEDAISKYEQAVKLDPDNHRILWKLARAYKKKEEWDKVATTCAKAEAADEKVNKKKTFAEYYFLHGYALEQEAIKGTVAWSEAKPPLTTTYQIDPNFAQAYFELGDVVLHADGQPQGEQGALENYTKAIQTKPDDLEFYVPLADLYTRLNMQKEAEQVLREGLTFGKDGDKHLFDLHALLGSVLENRGDISGAISEYEAAKKACDAIDKCNSHKEAYFILGGAYAEAKPPRKNEAVQQLQSFWKITCKGAQAAKYADQCTQTSEILKRFNASPQ